MNAPFHIETACSLAQARLRVDIDRRTLQAQLATVVEFAQAQAQARLSIGPVVHRRAGYVELPGFIRCPECAGPLAADVFEHNVDTGMPDTFGVHLCCTEVQEELRKRGRPTRCPSGTTTSFPSSGPLSTGSRPKGCSAT
ncbi:hypothetical protein [Pseudacidovorax sp. NFM-22]|uniref:hypothetical protein n=1 Tax=Pseudacidovorax sp. NFM-22 TaxID=2744469 RepID=UPI001F4347B8|nr:hypothetical protein [Pseudacidovorax sp. NFM-22]